jgi:hypothetical protein
MTLVRIREVTPLDSLRLRLRLTNDVVIERDVSAPMHGPNFEALCKDPAFFRDVRVEAGTVVWGYGADLCPDVPIWGDPPPGDAEAASIAATMPVSSPSEK